MRPRSCGSRRRGNSCDDATGFGPKSFESARTIASRAPLVAAYGTLAGTGLCPSIDPASTTLPPALHTRANARAAKNAPRSFTVANSSHASGVTSSIARNLPGSVVPIAARYTSASSPPSRSLAVTEQRSIAATSRTSSGSAIGSALAARVQ